MSILSRITFWRRKPTLADTLKPRTPSLTHLKAWQTRKQPIDRAAKIKADPIMRHVLESGKRPVWSCIDGVSEKKVARIALWSGGYRRCCYCNVKLQITDSKSRNNYATIEHIQPVALGGTNDLANLTLACLTCNKNRGTLLSQTLTNARAKLFAIGAVESMGGTQRNAWAQDPLRRGAA